ncbi:hypothetical protein AX16_005839 [Volvariella volvacea WC 439]|nr:hypothetical protein AX16_005839 [Volvariella volvacea WC 439]
MPGLQGLKLKDALPLPQLVTLPNDRIILPNPHSLSIAGTVQECASFLNCASFKDVFSRFKIRCRDDFQGGAYLILEPWITRTAMLMANMTSLYYRETDPSQLVLRWGHSRIDQHIVHNRMHPLVQLLPLSGCKKLTSDSSLSDEEWNVCAEHLMSLECIELLGWRMLDSHQYLSLVERLAGTESNASTSEGDNSSNADPRQVMFPNLKKFDADYACEGDEWYDIECMLEERKNRGRNLECLAIGFGPKWNDEWTEEVSEDLTKRGIIEELVKKGLSKCYEKEWEHLWGSGW